MAHTVHQTRDSGTHPSTGNSSDSFVTNPTAGRSVIVTAWGWRSAAAFDVTSITDNQGNTYTLVKSSASPGVSNMCGVIGFAHNITASGTFTVTVNVNSSSYYRWAMLEVSGLDTAGYDQTSTSTGNSTSPSTGNTGTLSSANELGIAVACVQGTISTIVVGGSWTEIIEDVDNSGSQAGESDRLDISATTAQSASWTATTSTNWTAIIVTFADAVVTTPISASDTLSISISESSAVAVTEAKAGTDTLSISVSETSALGITAAISGTDTLSIALSESGAIAARATASDTLSVAVSESSVRSIAVLVSDTLFLLAYDVAKVPQLSAYFLAYVTGATNASPIVITTNQAHGLVTGDHVTISEVTGNTAANGTWRVTVIDSTHFSLDGSVGNGTW